MLVVQVVVLAGVEALHSQELQVEDASLRYGDERQWNTCRISNVHQHGAQQADLCRRSQRGWEMRDESETEVSHL